MENLVLLSDSMEERKFEPLGSVEVINILPGYVGRQSPLGPVEPQTIAAMTLEDFHQRLTRFIN